MEQYNKFKDLIQKTVIFVKLHFCIDISVNYSHEFRSACSRGDLLVALLVYQISPSVVNSDLNEDIFCFPCINGHLEVVQWLYQLMPTKISDKNYLAFRLACEKGHLDVAQWLYQISNQSIDISMYNDWAFRYACEISHLEVAQWLQSLKPYLYVINYNEDGTYKDYTIRSKEEANWEQRKIPLWLASDQSPNKDSLFYKIPTDVSRYIIQSYL